GSAKRLGLPNWAIIPPKEDKKRMCPEAYAGDLLCYIYMKNFNSFHLGRVLINRDCSPIGGCRKRHTAARQDQAGQSGTHYGAGDQSNAALIDFFGQPKQKY